MIKRALRARQVALTVAGVAAVTGVGLGAVGAATAATPALHIKNSSEWTVEGNKVGCEVVTFSSGGSFVVSGGSVSGVWNGGGAHLVMKWTARGSSGLVFKGTYHSASKAYGGTFSGSAKGKGEVVPGSGC